MSFPSVPAAPERVGRYVVRRVVGRGSMGAVFLARDPVIDRDVALKLVQTAAQLGEEAREKYRQRFHQEAKAAGRLNHPGIVTVFDAGQEGDTPFIVMEYVEGETLHQRIEKKRCTVEESLRIAGEILDALDYAHARGIVHRDIKLANILLTREGRVKITDFGIAHVVGSELTGAHEILGSLNYMAPEQLNKETVDPRTDLFAFGVVLYRMLTGLLPFRGDSMAAIARAILSEEPVPPQDLEQEIPPELGRVVLRCLAKRPEERFPSAREARAALAAAASGARVAHPEERPAKTNRRLRGALAAAALTAGAGTGALWLWRSPAPPTLARAPEAERPSRAVARGEEEGVVAGADLLLQAGAALENGDLEESRSLLESLLEKSPEFPGAAELLERVEEGVFRRSLPLSYSARHNHRIGGCTGTLTLAEEGVRYRSAEHGSWIWSLENIRLMERPGRWDVALETYERDLLALNKPKSYKFELLDRPLEDEDWALYQRLTAR